MSMDNSSKLYIRLELIWWLATFLVVFSVLFPIYQALTDYPFWIQNTVFIVVFITITRYIFLLKYTFLAYRQWLKVVVAVLCIPLFLYLMKEVNLFSTIAGEIGIEEMFGHLSMKDQTDMSNYVRSEMLFFGAASVISTVIMPFRMIISFWRTHNRGTA